MPDLTLHGMVILLLVVYPGVKLRQLELRYLRGPFASKDHFFVPILDYSILVHALAIAVFSFGKILLQSADSQNAGIGATASALLNWIGIERVADRAVAGYALATVLSFVALYFTRKRKWEKKRTQYSKRTVQTHLQSVWESLLEKFENGHAIFLECMVIGGPHLAGRVELLPRFSKAAPSVLISFPWLKEDAGGSEANASRFCYRRSGWTGVHIDLSNAVIVGEFENEREFYRDRLRRLPLDMTSGTIVLESDEATCVTTGFATFPSELDPEIVYGWFQTKRAAGPAEYRIVLRAESLPPLSGKDEVKIAAFVFDELAVEIEAERSSAWAGESSSGESGGIVVDVEIAANSERRRRFEADLERDYTPLADVRPLSDYRDIVATVGARIVDDDLLFMTAISFREGAPTKLS